MELTTEQLLTSIWAALRRIEDNLSLPPAPLELPAPNVEIDLADVVTAVTGLKPGPTAEEIATAIASVLAPQRQESGSDALQNVAAALEKLDFRLQGMGTQAYGGGSVSLRPGQSVNIANQLIPSAYDDILMTYTGDNVETVTYKSGGATVATLTLTYAGDNVTRVQRT